MVSAVTSYGTEVCHRAVDQTDSRLPVLYLSGLIYMSTDAILHMAVQSGTLVPLVPISPRAMKRRALYVTEAIRGLLDADTGDDITEERYGRLRADLETFVVEKDLYPHYLYWLTPREDNVWEIRSIADAPSLRVLGCFAKKDIFVALTIEERAELGGWDSESWKRAKRTTIQRWRSVLTIDPIQGETQDDFFSGGIPGAYWKK